MAEGEVYVFGHELFPKDVVKIGGTSRTAEERLKDYGTSFPTDPELHFVVKTNDWRELESVLHDRFARRRFKGSEWFRVHPDEVRKVLKELETRSKLRQPLTVRVPRTVARLLTWAVSALLVLALVAAMA